MSDLVVFGFGSVIFVISTWATLAFGLSKMQELALRDVEASDRIRAVKQSPYTDIYVTQPLPDEIPESVAADSMAVLSPTVAMR